MILRAGLMKRVSTDEQANFGDSLQAQEEALVKYCKENNIKIVKIYSDEGFSARKPVLKRPAMLELLEDVEAGKLDIILFTKLDRWFRNVKEYHKIQEILERNKVVWKAILEDYSTATADGRLKVNIMLSVAENEADRTSERIKFVFQSKIMRKEAIFPNQNAPYGYKVVEIDGVRKVVKNEETREITEYFFKNVLLSSVRNAGIMTDNKYGIKRDYNSWLNMCHNEIYMGVYKGVEDYCEPYLTPTQFNELSKGKNYRTPTNNRAYLFTGLIHCPLCGRIMTAKSERSRRAINEIYYYRCPSVISKHCNQKYLPEKRVEEYVITNIKDELEKFILSHEVSQPKAKPKKLDSAKYKEQLRRVNVSYQAGNMEDDEYLAKTKELKAMIEKASKEEASDAPANLDALKEFLDSGFEKIYDSLDREEKRRLWRSVIDELEFDGTNITGIKFKA